MKKLAVLVAGVMLVGGTVFAGDLEVSGKVEHEALKINSNSETVSLTDAGDQYFMLDLTKEINETTTLTLGYDTDDANPDNVGSMKLNKIINEYVEAQVAVDVKTGAEMEWVDVDDTVDSDGDGDPTNDKDFQTVKETGFRLEESNGGDTYIKVSPSDVYSITFKPFEAGTGVGDELATKDTQDAGGVEVSFGADDAPMTLNGVVNFDDSYTDKDGDAYNSIGLKGGATFTGVENLSVTGELSMNTQDDESAGSDKATKMAINGRGSYTMGDLTLKGELLSVTLNKAVASDESGTGLFAKAEYNLGELASGVTAKANGSFKNYSEFFYFDDDNSAEEINHGGMNIIGAGVDFVWNGVTLGNELEMATTENKIFTDTDGKATDSETTFTTKVSVEF